MGVWVILHVSKWGMTFPIGVYDEEEKVEATLSYLEYLKASTSAYDRRLLKDIREDAEERTEERHSFNNNLQLAEYLQTEPGIFEDRGDYVPDAGYPVLVYLHDDQIDDVSIWEIFDNWKDKDLLKLIKTLLTGQRGDLWR